MQVRVSKSTINHWTEYFTLETGAQKVIKRRKINSKQLKSVIQNPYLIINILIKFNRETCKGLYQWIPLKTELQQSTFW